MTRARVVVLGTVAAGPGAGGGGPAHSCAAVGAGELTAEVLRDAFGPTAVARGRGRLEVRLGYPWLQVRVLDRLPVVRSRFLTPMVQEHAARFFRVSREPVVVDARWVPRRRGERPRAIAIAAAAPLLERIFATGREAGFGDIVVGAADVRARTLRLLPPRERLRARRLQRTATGLLVGAALGAWVAAAAFLWVRADRMAHEADRQLVALDSIVTEARAARERLETLERLVAALGPPGALPEDALRWLARVSAALPKAAYLEAVSWQPGDVGSLSGVAPRAAGVLAELDRTGAVPMPRLDGGAVRDPRTPGAERFLIRFGSAVSP